MNKNKAKFKQKYGFWNLIPLIIGSIIGVGSYFKIGKILHATEGNATSTILTWLVAIIMIICTSLIITTMMSSKEGENTSGGIIYVIDKHSNQHVAKIINILVISLYSPLIIIIEAVVATKFLFIDFLQIENNWIMFIFPILLIIFITFSNFKSVKFGQIFQSLSLIVKILPLILIIIIGLIVKPYISHETTYINEITSKSLVTSNSLSQILAALPAALFAMDGWQWISGLSMETKGGAKTLFYASIWGLITASIFYILYTLGGISIIKPEMWAKGAQITDVFKHLLNISYVDKAIDLFIVVAALGGLNAFSIYYIRQISATADNKWLFKANYFAKISHKSHLPENAGKLAIFYVVIIWCINVLCNYFFANYFNTKLGADFDITATINITSEVLTVGLWSFVYIILAYIAWQQRKENVELHFKLNNIVWWLCIIIMILGAILAWYVNFIQSPVIWIIGVVYIFILYVITPNK